MKNFNINHNIDYITVDCGTDDDNVKGRYWKEGYIAVKCMNWVFSCDCYFVGYWD